MEAGGVPTRKRSQVSEPDRRNAKRREVLKPASLKFTYEIVELTARTVDVSREGVSLEALGRIPLLVDVEGKSIGVICLGLRALFRSGSSRISRYDEECGPAVGLLHRVGPVRRAGPARELRSLFPRDQGR